MEFGGDELPREEDSSSCSLLREFVLLFPPEGIRPREKAMERVGDNVPNRSGGKSWHVRG